MNIETIISKMQSLDEQMRIINYSIFEMKQELVIYKEQLKNNKSDILKELRVIKDLQLKQQWNNKYILHLIQEK